MIGVVYSSLDIAATNIADALVSIRKFENVDGEKFEYTAEGVNLYRIGSQATHYDEADGLGLDLIIFLSMHRSAAGISAFTVHPTGNFDSNADLGGSPKALSVAAPSEMHEALMGISHLDLTGIEKSYEATHHGPLLRTPSFFLEIGGNSAAIESKPMAAAMARCLSETIERLGDGDSEYRKVALGLGCMHYPRKFTSLAIEDGYAFSHMITKHKLFDEAGHDNLDMLKNAIEKTNKEVDCAVIEWKGLKAEHRGRLIKALNEEGVDYERI